ncbi:hypothetical protein FIV34_16500 [Luteibacter pinisoli]|uniref:Uncharacterized protein n=1 Tax=Luteibacter pinisoli TaxID=2589080 RepID=A0A4Y5Z5J0_9GAMM|nr:hypothetical protein [Luteibacter pinisoli]QDE40692.1 hypothetical protein FIV34_16500 [Luteibacter pinisoli]
MNNEAAIDSGEARVLSRFLARKLSAEELEMISGGSCGWPTASTCSASDHNPCDLDNCDMGN